MSHASKKSLTVQVLEKINSMFTPGKSKHTAKIAANEYGWSRQSNASTGIYSYSTRKAYIKHCLYFVNWAKIQPVKAELGHKPRTLDECKLYAADYLKKRISDNLSAWTIRLDSAALAKLYGCHAQDFGVDLPKRHRANIVRSRNKNAVRDAHFSESRHKDFVLFCRCTGLRRSELQRLKGTALAHNLDGSYSISVVGKGGRHRYAPIIGTNEQIQNIVTIMQAAAENKVWQSVPSGADVHSYRADYCKKIYRKYARPRDKIPKDARYFCRCDQKGVLLDKRALQICSEALGHSRIEVVALSYLY